MASCWVRTEIVLYHVNSDKDGRELEDFDFFAAGVKLGKLAREDKRLRG